MVDILIALFGVSALWMINSQSLEYRRMAPVVGLLGQPFWLYATYNSDQWGMFFVCILYTVVWSRALLLNMGWRFL